MPETGAILSAIKRIVPEVNVTVIGKPESVLFEEALGRSACSPHDAIMIGDNPLTDLAGAARIGIPTYLVGTGQGCAARDIRQLLALDDRVGPRLNSEETPLITIDSPGLSAVLLQALENLGEAFVIWDHQDRMVHCNSKYSQFFDEPGVVVPGVRFDELVEFNIARNTVKAIVIGGSTVKGDELTPDIYRRKRTEFHKGDKGLYQAQIADGRWMQIRETRIPGGGTVGIYTDITARKEVEQQLGRAKAEADEANMAKSRFLAAASHDLRQPLHAIGIFLSALGPHMTSPESRDLLHNVEECLKTTNNLFNSLLDISKLDAGVLQPEKQPCAIGELFIAVEREFAPLAKTKNIRLKVDGTDLYAMSDPEMLGRIVRNFVSNGVKYTASGEVHVHAIVSGGDMVRIIISDTGSGIKDDDVSLIFQEFKQLGNSDEKKQGLGLGLSIATRLAHLLGHQIDVQSQVGKGSCFSVSLPMTENKGTGGPANDRTGASDETIDGLRVLVVEDDRDISNASEILLDQWGCDVRAVNSFNDAAGVLISRDWQPELIITDFYLGGEVTGADIVALSRRQAEFLVPVIIVTGDTGPGRLKEMQALNCPVMHKPIQPMKLRALLQSYIRQAVKG